MDSQLMSDYRKWTPEGEADAARAISRAVGQRAGCRRAVFLGSVAVLIFLVALIVAHLVIG